MGNGNGSIEKSPSRLNDELKSNYRYNTKCYEEDYNMESLAFVHTKTI